jgi:hypothetical protein
MKYEYDNEWRTEGGGNVIDINILSRHLFGMAEEKHDSIHWFIQLQGRNWKQISPGHRSFPLPHEMSTHERDQRNNTAIALKKLRDNQGWIGAEIFKHLPINIYLQHVRKSTRLNGAINQYISCEWNFLLHETNLNSSKTCQSGKLYSNNKSDAYWIYLYCFEFKIFVII